MENENNNEEIIEEMVENSPVNLGQTETDLNLEKALDELELDNNFIKLPVAKFILLKKTLARLEENVSQVKSLLAAFDDEPALITTDFSKIQTEEETNGSMEGVFDGERMIGSNGETYPIPANYASKSKLVEGDILKMTVTNKGQFLFKQISPIERKRLHGVVAEDEAGNFWVVYDNQKWRILTASVTFYKGSAGDVGTILVPKDGLSRWAAVEHIAKK